MSGLVRYIAQWGVHCRLWQGGRNSFLRFRIADLVGGLGIDVKAAEYFYRTTCTLTKANTVYES